MSPDSPPAAIVAPELSISAPPGLFALFVAFARMSLSGFGGVLAFARRGIVDEHRWMTAEEFNETFALCHFLPGPNIVNLSVVFGSRFRGIAGGFAAFAGLLAYLHVMPARFLSGGLEMILPLSAGVIVATVISHDPAVELQLTMPRKYDVTGIRRLGLIAAWTAIIAVLSSFIISLLQLTFEPAQLKSWSAPLQLLKDRVELVHAGLNNAP